MNEDTTAVAVKKSYLDFLNAPYPTKKYYAEAREVWEEYAKCALKNRKDAWDNLYEFKDSVLGNEIRGALRGHIAKLQKNRCCYCQTPLQNIAHAKPLEHILPRKDYPQFSVLYENIAVSCFNCNHHKSAANWGSLDKKATKYYKSEKEITTFFHPRFHIYDAHIRYVKLETNDTLISIYMGQTEQGRHLCRKLLMEISRQDALYRNNPTLKSSIEKLQQYGLENTQEGHSELSKFRDLLHQAIIKIGDA